MGGSKKGEHRGNARKRPEAPGGVKIKRKHEKRTHETVGEILDDAMSREGHNRLEMCVIERRIRVARIIHGQSTAIEDVTPKEALMLGMRHNLQAYWDWIGMIEQWSALEPTPELNRDIEMAEHEAERLLDKMGEFAFKVAPFVHPKYQAQNITHNIPGMNPLAVIQELFDEVDARERAKPIPIEYKPQRTG